MSSAAQTVTLMEWSEHLQQRSKLATSPLSHELQQLLGLVTYQDVGTEVAAPLPTPGPTTVNEGPAPVPEEAWYRHTGGSCLGQPPSWRVEAC